MKLSTYKVLAYYCFTPIADPEGFVKDHKAFFADRDVMARIYVSKDGINGQMSASSAAAEEYMRWLRGFEGFASMPFKIQSHHEHAFPRLTVKVREQLVALGSEVDMSQAGEHVSPSRWREMLESGEALVLDVRNDYECALGHFEGAELPSCRTFREFNDYAEGLKERVDAQETPVMMYCTGGIRCELYSSLLKQSGFERVYQLEGGVINYGAKEGSTHWLGKLFVFDDRLGVPISDEATEVIGRCHHCECATESYYNCANVHCNELFLCCVDCLPSVKGCCCADCEKSPRVRPYQQQQHKPFRRWSAVVDKKEDLFVTISSEQGVER